jgi:hypothetical protein
MSAELGTMTIRAGQDAGDSVHWLPVKTSHSGQCKVDEFFRPQPLSGGEPQPAMLLLVVVKVTAVMSST